MFYDQEANKMWVKYDWLTMKRQTGRGKKGEIAFRERRGQINIQRKNGSKIDIGDIKTLWSGTESLPENRMQVKSD